MESRSTFERLHDNLFFFLFPTHLFNNIPLAEKYLGNWLLKTPFRFIFVNCQIFECMKWCDEVQRQIFEGILTHLSNYMLNWPKIICHPKLLSRALPLFSDPPLSHTLLRGTREAQNSRI